MSQVPFPSRTQVVSGGATTTIFSGVGVFLGVIVNQLSGGTPSYSGVSDIIIQDATSGMFSKASGNALLYSWSFGAQSGYGDLRSAPDDVPYTEQFCNSGLVVSSTSGWSLAVAFNK